MNDTQPTTKGNTMTKQIWIPRIGDKVTVTEGSAFIGETGTVVTVACVSGRWAVRINPIRWVMTIPSEHLAPASGWLVDKDGDLWQWGKERPGIYYIPRSEMLDEYRLGWEAAVNAHGPLHAATTEQAAKAQAALDERQADAEPEQQPEPVLDVRTEARAPLDALKVDVRRTATPAPTEHHVEYSPATDTHEAYCECTCGWRHDPGNALRAMRYHIKENR